MEDSNNAIEVRDVKKKFKIFIDKGSELKERILFKERKQYEEREVLKGISFDVKKGEAIGLIGHNGCGKSTTLKLLTRIYYPDEGTVEMAGRVSSLIELGAGFHPDMSGRENIYTNASIFGLSKKEIDDRLEDIIDFSELEDFIDNPVRTYSSGMYMRLAFSVAINVDADILLIDEILAVGDANFQRKCFDRLREIKRKGTTIVIVSHSLGQIEQICDTTYWIEDGVIKESGVPRFVHERYMYEMERKRILQVEKEQLKKQQRRKEEYLKELEEEAKAEAKRKKKEKEQQEEAERKAEEDRKAGIVDNFKKKLPYFCEPDAVRTGTGEAEFVDIKLTDKDGNEKYIFDTEEKIYVRIKYKAYKDDLKAVLGYGVFRQDGLHCYGTNTAIESNQPINLNREGEAVIVIENNLLPAYYYIDNALHGTDGVKYDDIVRTKTFMTASYKHDIGISRIKSTFTVDGKTYLMGEQKDGEQ